MLRVECITSTNTGFDSANISIGGSSEGRQLPFEIFRRIQGARTEEERTECLGKLWTSDQRTLREIQLLLIECLKSELIKPKESPINSRISFSLPFYASLIANESKVKLYLAPDVFELLGFHEPTKIKKLDHSLSWTPTDFFINGGFQKREFSISAASQFNDKPVTDLAGLAQTVATMLAGPEQRATPEPALFWELLQFILKDSKLGDEPIFSASALAWCQASEIISTRQRSESGSSVNKSEDIYTLLAVPNSEARRLSRWHMQNMYSAKFNDDQPQSQYDRLLANKAFEGFIQVIKEGCPLFIPKDGDGLIRPLCWVEKRTGKDGEPYLHAQVIWVTRSDNGTPILFCARYHTLHRSFHLKCPSMRVQRIVPSRFVDRNIGNIQYLLDMSCDGAGEAIRKLQLTSSILPGPSGYQWICWNKLNGALVGASKELTDTMQRATHFVYHHPSWLHHSNDYSANSENLT